MHATLGRGGRQADAAHKLLYQSMQPGAPHAVLSFKVNKSRVSRGSWRRSEPGGGANTTTTAGSPGAPMGGTMHVQWVQVAWEGQHAVCDPVRAQAWCKAAGPDPRPRLVAVQWTPLAWPFMPFAAWPMAWPLAMAALPRVFCRRQRSSRAMGAMADTALIKKQAMPFDRRPAKRRAHMQAGGWASMRAGGECAPAPGARAA